MTIYRQLNSTLHKPLAHTFSPSDLWLEAGCTVNQQLSSMEPGKWHFPNHIHVHCSLTLRTTLFFSVLQFALTTIHRAVKNGKVWEHSSC